MFDYLKEDIQVLLRNNEYNKIVELTKKNLDQNLEMNITEQKNNHFILAKAYYFLTKNILAYEHITFVVKILEEHEFPPNEIIDAKIEYAKILRRMGRYNLAKEVYSDILDQYRKDIGDQDIAVIYHNLANLYMEEGNFEQSIELFQIVLEIDQKNQNEEGQAPTLSSLGGLYFYLGNYSEAIDFYLQSLELRKKLNDVLGEATVSLNLGSVYANQLEEKLALEFLDRAEELFKEMNHYRGIHSVLSTKARMNFSLGNYSQVIENLKYIESKTESEITQADLSLILILAESLLKEKIITEVRSIIELGLKGLHLLTAGKHIEMVQDYGRLKQMLSQVAVLQNNYDEALGILDELEELGKQIKDDQSFIAIYHGRSYIHLIKGDYEKALIFAEKGRDLAMRFKDTSIVEILELLFEIHLSLGDFNKCIKTLKKVSKYIQVANEMKYKLIIRTFNLLENIKLKGIKKEFSVLLKLAEHGKSLYVQQETLGNVLQFTSNEKREEILKQMEIRIQKETSFINSKDESELTLENNLKNLIKNKKKLAELSITELLSLLDSIFFSIKYNFISEKYLQEEDWALMLPEEAKYIVKQKQYVLQELLHKQFELENFSGDKFPFELKFTLMFTKFYNELLEFQGRISDEDKTILLYLISSVITDTLFVLYFSDKNE